MTTLISSHALFWSWSIMSVPITEPERDQFTYSSAATWFLSPSFILYAILFLLCVASFVHIYRHNSLSVYMYIVEFHLGHITLLNIFCLFNTVFLKSNFLWYTNAFSRLMTLRPRCKLNILHFVHKHYFGSFPSTRIAQLRNILITKELNSKIQQLYVEYYFDILSLHNN